MTATAFGGASNCYSDVTAAIFPFLAAILTSQLLLDCYFEQNSSRMHGKSSNLGCSVGGALRGGFRRGGGAGDGGIGGAEVGSLGGAMGSSLVGLGSGDSGMARRQSGESEVSGGSPGGRNLGCSLGECIGCSLGRAGVVSGGG